MIVFAKPAPRGLLAASTCEIAPKLCAAGSTVLGDHSLVCLDEMLTTGKIVLRSGIAFFSFVAGNTTAL